MEQSPRFLQSCTLTWKTWFWENRGQSLKTGWIIVLINRPWKSLGPASQKLSWFQTSSFRKGFLTCFRLEISNKNRFFESDTQVYPLKSIAYLSSYHGSILRITLFHIKFLYWRKENDQPRTKWFFLKFIFFQNDNVSMTLCHPLQVKNTFISVFTL